MAARRVCTMFLGQQRARHTSARWLQENLKPRVTPSSSLALLASDRASLGAGLANADIQMDRASLVSGPGSMLETRAGFLRFPGHPLWPLLLLTVPGQEKPHNHAGAGWGFQVPLCLAGKFSLFLFGHLLFNFFKVFVYLTTQGLGCRPGDCRTQTLRCGMWDLVP